MPPFDQQAWGKIAAVLASIVSAGFLAWAAVVWNATTDIRAIMWLMSDKMTKISAQVEGLRFGLDRHHEIRWHPGAGEAIATLQAEIESLQMRVDRIESAVVRP